MITVASSSECLGLDEPPNGIGVAHREQKRASSVFFAPQTTHSTTYDYLLHHKAIQTITIVAKTLWYFEQNHTQGWNSFRDT